MRITNNMIGRNYTSRMRTNLGNLTKSNDKMASQKAFNKSHENVQDAGRALKTRKLLFDNDQYQISVRDAKGRATAAEDAIRGVNTQLIGIKEKLVQGANGTLSPEDRDKLATEVARIQDDVFQVMNTQYSETFLFGAAGNDTGEAPFTTENGRLMYNGTAVDTMDREMGSGVIVDSNGDPVKYDVHNYVDIGYGYELLPDGSIDPNTAFKNTYSGLECFGFGVNAEGVPVNAHSLLGDIVSNLEQNDLMALDKDLRAISGTMDVLLTAVTDIGARSNTLDNVLENLEAENQNLLEVQNQLEGLDISEEIIYNKQHEMSWLVTLQLGSKVLPQSLFDFLR